MQTAFDLIAVALAAVGAVVAPQIATVLLLALIYVRVTEIARRARA